MNLSLLVRATVTITFAAALSISGSNTHVAAQADANTVVPQNAYKDLKWRSVGATRGGRVTAYGRTPAAAHLLFRRRRRRRLENG